MNLSCRESIFFKFGILFIGSILGWSLFALPSALAATRTWDGGGTDGTCGGQAGDGNKWSCAANWSSDIAPVSGDVATFSSSSTKNATIDTAFTIDTLSISSGYTGTITQAADLTIENDFTHSVTDGTFTWSSGTLTFTGSLAVSWNIDSGDDTFGDLTIDKNDGVAVTITTLDNPIVSGTLTLTNGNLNSSGSTTFLDATGPVTVAATFDGGTSTLRFSGSTTRTVNLPSGAQLPRVSVTGANTTINGPASGSVTFDSTFTLTAGSFVGSASDMTLGGTLTVNTPATFTAPSGTLTSRDITVDAAGSFIHNSGTITTGGTNTYTLVSGVTFNNFIQDTFSTQWSGTPTIAGTYTCEANYLIGSLIIAGDFVQEAGCNANSTGSVAFGDDSEAQTYTVNGGSGPEVIFNSSGDEDDSVVFAAAGAIALEITSDFSGAVTISNPSDFTVEITGLTQAAGTLDVSDQSEWQLADLNFSGGTFVGPVRAIADGNNNQTWHFLGGTQTFEDLTINETDSFTLNEEMFISGDLELSANAVFTSGTVYVGGDITQDADFLGGGGKASFNNNLVTQTYTVPTGETAIGFIFDSPYDANDNLTMAGDATLSVIQVTSDFSGTVPVYNPTDAVILVEYWEQSAGNYDATSQSEWRIYSMGMYGGTFMAPDLVNLDGPGSYELIGASPEFSDFTINDSGEFGLDFGFSTDPAVVNGTFTVTEGSFYNGSVEARGDVVIEATSDANPFEDPDYDSGTLIFGGDATQTFTLTGAEALHDGSITVRKSGGQVVMASDLILDFDGDTDLGIAPQALSIANGTLSLAGHDLTVNGAETTFVVEDGGNFQWQGGETLTLDADMPELQSGSIVTYTGNGNAGANTYTITTLADMYSNLVINSTDGATDTFQLGEALDVNADLTITAGTLDVVAGQDYAITVAGDWGNTGTFTARSGTVTLDGTDQTIAGTTTFNNFTKTVSTSATLTLPPAATQTFLGTLTLTGADGERLALRSSTPGTQAKIDPQGSRTITYLDVRDNDNDNATAMSCPVTCHDSGNNENWTLAVASSSGGGGSWRWPSPELEEEQGTDDGEEVPLEEGEIVPGDYMRGVTLSTVYYIDEDLKRHPIPNERTFFTYEDSWEVVKFVADETLAAFKLGDIVKPKSGVVLIKIMSVPEVYSIAADGILHHIASEEQAETIYGSEWSDYVIDIEPTFWSKFTFGDPVTDLTPADLSVMRKRTELRE